MKTRKKEKTVMVSSEDKLESGTFVSTTRVIAIRAYERDLTEAKYLLTKKGEYFNECSTIGVEEAFENASDIWTVKKELDARKKFKPNKGRTRNSLRKDGGRKAKYPTDNSQVLY
jgi:hypothetical protein